MRNQKTTPSEFLPDYLKMDLGLGTTKAHPITRALDETFAGLSAISYQIGLGIQPELFSGEQQEFTLRRLGFTFDTLSASQIELLYRQMHPLLRERGTLSAVERLANIHFGGAVVQRGYPRQSSVAGQFPQRAVDTGAADRVVFVRLTRAASPVEKLSFESNCQLVIPQPFRVVTADPIVLKPPAVAGIRLTGSITLGRRL